jgi:hypothetical protein
MPYPINHHGQIWEVFASKLPKSIKKKYDVGILENNT